MFTAEEEAFFREGDAMSALCVGSGAVEAEIIDLPSYHPRGTRIALPIEVDYYASFSLTVEADEMSGGFEAAA